MMNQEKIQELVNRSQQNDKRAFALLVSEFQPLVFRLAFRFLCDEDEARDITQETFVKVWLSLKTYNQENRLSTWLYKITCNTCYDRLRSLHHSPLDNESAFYLVSQTPFLLLLPQAPWLMVLYIFSCPMSFQE